ncbi:MAG: Uma2 family endonuclease [Acidimicrobiales bacterium]
MRVFFVDAPPELLEERRRLGLDVRDELWEGVVHVVPQPETDHQVFTGRFLAALLPLADERGLVLAYDVAIYRPGEEKSNYRVPDLVLARPEYKARRGIAGPPELVVETLSPHDEPRAKLPFYAAIGCLEVLLIDRARRALEVCRLIDGDVVRVVPDKAGTAHIQALGVDLSVVGPSLRLAWDGGEAEIAL